MPGSSSQRSASAPGQLLRELAVHAAVELHAAHGRQVVALAVEEQVVEQVLGRVLGRRLARAHHPVDLDQRLEAGRRRVDPERVRDVRAAVQVVDVERADLGHVRVHEALDQRGRQHVVGRGKHLAGLRVGDVVGEDLALEVFDRHVQAAHAGFLELAHVARGDAATFLDDDLAVRADLEHRESRRAGARARARARGPSWSGAPYCGRRTAAGCRNSNSRARAAGS